MIDKDYVFDLMRGIAAFTDSRLVAALAAAIAEYPDAPFDNAFNHKQVTSKQWARDMLAGYTTGQFHRVWVLGGWLGVLPAMLFADERFDIASIVSFDIDPCVGKMAEKLNQPLRGASSFEAVTADMYKLDYGGQNPPDLVINTSCEHISDLPAWLGLLPRGAHVLLQSNNYVSEPTHVNCVMSQEEFQQQAGLHEIQYSGQLELPKYTRFMLIGRV